MVLHYFRYRFSAHMLFYPRFHIFKYFAWATGGELFVTGLICMVAPRHGFLGSISFCVFRFSFAFGGTGKDGSPMGGTARRSAQGL